jgi:hypothetical protein
MMPSVQAVAKKLKFLSFPKMTVPSIAASALLKKERINNPLLDANERPA